jgi:hypothetical protein
MAEGSGNAPASAMPILFSGQVQPAYICLPSKNDFAPKGIRIIMSGDEGAGSGFQKKLPEAVRLTEPRDLGTVCGNRIRRRHHLRHSPVQRLCQLAARVGLAPTPNGLTGRRATFTLPGNSELALPAGIAPASVRLEDERLVYFGHGSILKMVGTAGFPPATSRSQAARSED